MLVHNFFHIMQSAVRKNRERGFYFNAFSALNSQNFFHLLFYWKKSMDNSNASLARKGNSHRSLANAVHVRGDNRNIQFNFSREKSFSRNFFPRNNRRFFRNQKHIIKRYPFFYLHFIPTINRSKEIKRHFASK